MARAPLMPICARCGKSIAGEPVTFTLARGAVAYHPGHAPRAAPPCPPSSDPSDTGDTGLKGCLDGIARLLDAEDGLAAREAIQAIQAIQSFAQRFGITIVGTVDPVMRVHTEWLGAADQHDQDVFVSFAETLYAIAQHVGRRHEFDAYAVRNLLDQLREDLPRIEAMHRDESHGHGHGAFIIIPTKGVENTTDAVRTLEEAAALVQAKFPAVLYGKVYVRKDLRPKGTYDPRPGSSGSVAGSYQGAKDTITLSMYATPTRTSVDTLIHELGHRYHTRILTGDARERFVQLSTVGDVREHFFQLRDRLGFADEYIARLRGFRDDPDFGNEGPVDLSPNADIFFGSFVKGEAKEEFRARAAPLMRRFEAGEDAVAPALRDALARSWLGGNLRVVEDEHKLRPVLASSYGGESWEENFAESFLAFVRGKPLPEPLQAFMQAL
jgi:hypothetical protein